MAQWNSRFIPGPEPGTFFSRLKRNLVRLKAVECARNDLCKAVKRDWSQKMPSYPCNYLLEENIVNA